MQFGNKEVRRDAIFELGEFMEFRPGADDDELYFKPRKETYSVEEIKKIELLIAELGPDEYSVEDDYIRFWWD